MQQIAGVGRARKEALKDLEAALPKVYGINKSILDDELKNFPQPAPSSIN